MIGFKHELIGKRKNATYASIEGCMMSNESERIDNKVSVAAGIKLVRTTATNLIITVSDLSPDFCIDEPLFKVIIVNKYAVNIKLNMSILLME